MRVLTGLLPLLALGACGDRGPVWKADSARTEASASAGYLSPPRVRAVRTGRAGVALAGSAAPGSRVRLFAPSGDLRTVTADARGLWVAVTPPSADLRLLGLAMTVGGRTISSEGYLAVTPEGRVAELRPGAGAVVLAPASRRPTILALDYDRDGAAMISGVGTTDAELGLRVDRTAAGGSKVDRQGRFSFALVQPLSAGIHAFEISGEGGEDLVTTEAARPGPLDRLFRAARTPVGWRIDWMTPGGGIQTTLLIDPAGPGG